jgi:hypothetical protein
MIGGCLLAQGRLNECVVTLQRVFLARQFFFFSFFVCTE